jgi:GNAT superfamily N-acetyltransferase
MGRVQLSEALSKRFLRPATVEYFEKNRSRLKQVWETDGFTVGLIYRKVRGKHTYIPNIVVYDHGEVIGRSKMIRHGGFITLNYPLLRKDYRGRGLGYLFYKYVLDHMKAPLRADSEQSPGSASNWNRLARDPEYLVYARVRSGRRIEQIVVNPGDHGRPTIPGPALYDADDGTVGELRKLRSRLKRVQDSARRAEIRAQITRIVREQRAHGELIGMYCKVRDERGGAADRY